MAEMRKHTVIAVAGGSGSGKTSIVRELMRKLGEEACLIDQDSYFETMGDGDGNFDVPHAIDHQLLSDHIFRLRSGSLVSKPRYSFATHQRMAATDPISPAPLIILEGLFAYWDDRVRSNCDLKVYIEAAADLRFIRRLKRDVRERERTIDSIVSQYIETVRPMHEKYSQQMCGHADLIIVNDGQMEQPVAMLLDAIHQTVARRKSSVAAH
jgi:uridine kinase